MPPASNEESSIEHARRRIVPHRIFGDEHGVLPIWRVLVYVAAYYVLRTIFLLIAAAAVSARRDLIGQLWLYFLEESLLLVAALAPALFLAKIEEKPFGTFGLPARSAFGKEFWSGVIWGFVGISLLLFAMRGLGVFAFGKLAVHGLRLFKFGAFWGVFFLIVGFYEDFLFRGYSLVTLSQATGFWPAALLTSLIFGSIHLRNPGEAWVGALGAACVGLFFCLTLRRTGTLWFAIGMHASWDWGESFFYSVPDSGQMVPGHLLNASFHGPRWLTGGSVGPEGSVLVFVVIALMWVVFDRIYPARKLAVPAEEHALPSISQP